MTYHVVDMILYNVTQSYSAGAVESIMESTAHALGTPRADAADGAISHRR
jgi:hypothetical protein